MWEFVLISTFLWCGLLTIGFVYSLFTEEVRDGYDIAMRIAALLAVFITSAFSVLISRIILESISVFFSTYSRVGRIAAIAEEFELERQQASA